MSEEAWEWDGTCSECYRSMDWEGDEPESEDEALCLECERDILSANIQRWQWAVVLQQFILPDVGWLLYASSVEGYRAEMGGPIGSLTREEYGLGWAWAP